MRPGPQRDNDGKHDECEKHYAPEPHTTPPGASANGITRRSCSRPTMEHVGQHVRSGGSDLLVFSLGEYHHGILKMFYKEIRKSLLKSEQNIKHLSANLVIRYESLLDA